MGEVTVLGRFVPSTFTNEVIQAEIVKHLPPCCQKERISVRVPHEHAPDPNPDNLQWHHDGGGVEGTIRHMVVWASESPTHILTSDGVQPSVQPFDVVLFDNDKAFHKQPEGTNERQRWFVSVRCSETDPFGLNKQEAVTGRVDVPSDVTQDLISGYYNRAVTRDGVQQLVRVCEDCWQVIPRYVDFPMGLVSPESDKKTRKAVVEGKDGVEHLRQAVCLPCYLKAFERVYPGATYPVLSDAVIGDDVPPVVEMPPPEISVPEPGAELQ